MTLTRPPTLGDTQTKRASEVASATSPAWRHVDYVNPSLRIAERHGLGTAVRVVVQVGDAPADDGDRVCDSALAAVDALIAKLDLVASRFRPDSELEQLNSRNGGRFVVGAHLGKLLDVALAGARWTNGLVDPTMGEQLVAAGYDRDFATLVDRFGADSAVDLDARGPEGADLDGADPRRPSALVVQPPARPSWRDVDLAGSLLHVPKGIRFDLGATAKSFGADVAARAASKASGADVLVSLGGDIAIGHGATESTRTESTRTGSTRAPLAWPVVIEEGPHARPATPVQQVSLTRGGLATSSTTKRRWQRAGQVHHHVIDPSTGRPAIGPWRTATVVAATCVEANVATTAVIAGGPGAVRWLEEQGLPARLVSADGSVMRLGGWPADEGAALPVINRHHLHLSPHEAATAPW